MQGQTGLAEKHKYLYPWPEISKPVTSTTGVFTVLRHVTKKENSFTQQTLSALIGVLETPVRANSSEGNWCILTSASGIKLQH